MRLSQTANWGVYLNREGDYGVQSTLVTPWAALAVTVEPRWSWARAWVQNAGQEYPNTIVVFVPVLGIGLSFPSTRAI